MVYPMASVSHPFVALGLLSTAVAVVIAVFAGTQRETRGAVTYGGVMLVLAVWSGLYVGQLLEPTLAGKRPWFVTRHAMVPLISVMFWLFAAFYTDRADLRSPRFLGPILAVGSLVTAGVVLNPGHVYWTATGMRTGGSIELLVVAFGPLFWANLLFMTVVVGGGHLAIVAMLKTTFEGYRRHLATMTAAGAIEFTLALVWLSDHLTILPSLNPWPHLQLITYGATLVAVPLGLSYFNDALFDIQPVAKHAVIQNMDDAVFVVDESGVVRFTNPQANRLLGRATAVDREPVEAVFADRPELLESYRAATATGSVDAATPVAYTVEGETVYFDLRVSEITNSMGEPTGVVMVARNVTDAQRQSARLQERTAQLERRTQQLEERNEQLDNFRQFVSHDLRNPIQIASGYVELARQTGETTHLEQTAEAIERMDEMITDLHELTRVDGAELAVEEVSLQRVARDAWAVVDTGAATLAIHDDVVVEADGEYLRHVFENLIRNAVEHGSPDPADPGRGLTIGVGPLAGGFYIEDDGVGIPEDERDTVLDHGYTTADDGTGLGMSIVETVATAHGWTVTVTESAGGGARFEVGCVELCDRDETRASVETG